MKEILYIQAGEQANYIGTHFWNTQESYFTYEDGEDSETDHGISFREGLNQKANALFGVDDAADGQALWSGNAVEYKQEPVSKSHYQIDMEELDTGYTSSAVQRQDIRYWSDFNRLFYVPRTIQKVPDIPEWEDAEGNWAGGREMFTRYDEGIQLMHDTSTFGSFLPLFSWSLLSDATPFKPMDNKRGVRKLVNDALTMRSLSEMSSISVPIQSPTTWTDEVRQHCLCGTRTLFQLCKSYLLLPRLKAAKEDILSFSARLGWRTAVPFAELRGVFPYVDAVDLERRIYNFSSCTPTPTSATQFSRYDVTRGFPSSGIAAYNQLLSGFGFEASVVSSTHAAAYPLPTSFPPFFSSAETTFPQSGPPGILSRPRSTVLFSSIGASGASDFYSGYARFLDESIRRKISVETTGGIDLDEMSDLANDLWTLHDTAGGEPDPTSDSDGRGEDEE
ncbi:Misato segment II tubulin-like domain-containing protein [Mycena olivaceomarginata]|nr:Misato segment II tubulin-like domain-containing protein [Mycena olivaceomarginata]